MICQTSHWLKKALLMAILITLGAHAQAQVESKEEQTIKLSTRVVNDIMRVPAKQIPAKLLANAQGIAVIPDVVKVGFIGGVRHGKGVLLVRDEERGGWIAPQFISLTGGSVGWQVGVQATDIVLVFKSKQSVQKVFENKFTIGADAAAAAGPVGRQAAAATDGQLRAEIYSYSQSRGLFAGVSIDGSVLQADAAATNAYYYNSGAVGPDGTPQAVIPKAATELVATVTQYAGPAVPDAQAVSGNSAPSTSADAGTRAQPRPIIASEVPGTVANGSPSLAKEIALRRQLIAQTNKLHALLDPIWRQYLTLPAAIAAAPDGDSVGSEVYLAAKEPFERVAGNPRYTALSNRPEFQDVQKTLDQLIELTKSAKPKTLDLPPPPTGN